jgi:hypothetical protein
MNFCSLEVVADRIPSDREIERMVQFVAGLKSWTESYLFLVDQPN